MKILLVTLAVFIASAVADKCEEKCASCKPLSRSECLAGVTKDGECQCCDVCARVEGQTCDMKDAEFKIGKCGYGLECKNVTGGRNLCQCVWDEIICGTDGVTYSNLCELMAAAVREGKQETLEVKSVGPCSPGAHIVTKPEYVRNTTNSNVVLFCEAIGFPTPTIHWELTRANKKTTMMPDCDNNVLVAMRGGPGKYQVTGWLQIEGLQKRHEGDYSCVAVNEINEDRSKARVKVAD